MASEDVINPSALACFFEDDNVFGLFDDTDSAFIAAGIGANGAGIGFGEVIADFALFDFGFDVANGLCEGEGVGGFGFEDMEGQPFGGLRANARKASQLLNQFINGFSIASRHKIPLININAEILPRRRQVAKSFMTDDFKMGPLLQGQRSSFPGMTQSVNL